MSLENKDINITVTHGLNFREDFTVNQRMSINLLCSNIFKNRHSLVVDGQRQPLSLDILKDLGIKPGSTVQVMDVQQPLPPQDSS